MAVTRSVTDVGPGDYVLVHRRWERILSNTAYDVHPLPREWTVVTDLGTYTMWDIRKYAKAEDLGL